MEGLADGGLVVGVVAPCVVVVMGGASLVGMTFPALMQIEISIFAD
jgi:hypothetical protein